MNAAELMKRVTACGVDLKGVNDRFMGNDPLYQTCFLDFINEHNVVKLKQSMAAKDYARAFEAAHALKGLSGNLGLSPYYDAVNRLVESLRAGRTADADAEYAAVEKQYGLLEALLEDQAPDTAAPAPRPKSAAADPPPMEKRSPKRDKFIPAAALTLTLIAGLVFLLFNRLTANYKRNVIVESANHLVEINYQLQQSIEDRIDSDWMIAYTVGASVVDSCDANDDASLRHLMKNVRDIWGLSNITLYTQNGYNVDVNGRSEANDLASDRIDKARKLGEYMAIMDSSITYTVPIDTVRTYKGSQIAAVSVMKNMSSFLDDMDFSSFGDTAYMYLSNDEGKVISRLTNNQSSATFNVMTLFRDDLITASGKRVSARELLTAEIPTAYIDGEQYVVSTPIHTRRGWLRVVYIVAEGAVNKTLDSYSGNVIVTSFAVLALFAVCALIVIIYLNRLRKRQMDSALMAREHTFDLLVKNSRTAFGLFKVDRPSPVYISSNALAVMGDESPGLFKKDGVFRMQSASGIETPAFNHINEAMRSWEGTTAFRSGFILNDASSLPSRYFELQLMPIAGQVDEYVGVAQDVTLLYEREAATQKALAMAEHASEAKTRFLSNMSHDIRTPMNAIVNMADFAIEDMDKPDKLREHLKVIRESSDHLLMLINDILDMSRIESGNAVIEAAPFDLLLELKRLESIVTPLCAAKEQTLLTDFSGVETAGVIGDRVKVSQILMNLLANAVKFTPKHGAVRFVAAETPAILENYVSIRFTVEDNGIGISKAFMPHLFSPFAREDDKRVSGIEGTGLGLSICYSYVVAMGGDIQCVSEEGEGSVFTVELFFEKTNAVLNTRVETTAWEVNPFIGMRCLLCEDNPTNQRIARTILERLGFRVDIANDGKEGVEMFEAFGAYDVIYMDIQMPMMDGYEATAAIRGSRSRLEQAKTIPIIAMSANVFIEDIEKAHIAGMDGHVGKPVTTMMLANETKRVLSMRRRTDI